MTTAEAFIFNVDHGDSTVIRIDSDNCKEPKWVVIDTNVVRRNEQSLNPSHRFLLEQGVKTIDILIITHLHADHYHGFENFVSDFEISKLVIPPFLSQTSKTIRKEAFQRYQKKVLSASRRSNGAPALRGQLESLATLLRYIYDNPQKVVEVDGPESILRIPGIDTPVLRVLLPLRAMRGILVQRIMDDAFELDSFPEMNDSSVVVQLEVHGQRLLWGADSTLLQWMEHRRRTGRDGIVSLGASVVKVPHHGSRHNAASWLIDYLMGTPSTGKTFVISANGRSHPHKELLEIAKAYEVNVYCTNLANQCGADVLASLEELLRVPIEARTFLINYGGARKTVPCQGDVTIRVDGTGVTTANSTGQPCVHSLLLPRPRRRLLAATS